MPRSGGFVLTLLESQSTTEVRYELVTMLLDATGAKAAELHEPIILGGFVPATATNGVVTVVADTPSSTGLDRRVSHRTVDTAGRVSPPELLGLANARQEQPQFAGHIGPALAVFTEESDRKIVRAWTTDFFGNPVRRVIAENASVAGELTTNGQTYLALVNAAEGLTAYHLDAEANVIGDPIVLGETAWFGAAATWATDRWLVVWTSLRGANFASVSTAGVVLDSRKLPIDGALPEGWSRSTSAMAIAADGPRILLAYVETLAPPCMMPICHTEKPVAWAMRLRNDGTALDEPVRVGEGTHHLSIATSGDEFVVVADSAKETLLTAIDDTATLRVIGSRAIAAGLSDIAWNGRQFLLAQRHREELPNHLVLFRLDGSLQEVAPATGVATLASDERKAPSIVGRGPGDALIGLQEGTFVDGARAVIYSERELEALPDWPPARRRAVR